MDFREEAVRLYQEMSLSVDDEKNLEMIEKTLRNAVKEEHSDYLQMHHAFYSEAELRKGLELRVSHLQEALLAECLGTACCDLRDPNAECFVGYRKCKGCEDRAKRALGTLIEKPDSEASKCSHSPVFSGALNASICELCGETLKRNQGGDR